jgi:hypothetical protein
MLRIGGLREKVVGAELHRADGVFNASMTRGYDHGDRDLSGLDLLDHLHAAELRHLEIGDDQTVRILREQFEALGTILGRIDLQIERRFEEFHERSAGVFHVFDDEDTLLGRGGSIGDRHRRHLACKDNPDRFSHWHGSSIATATRIPKLGNCLPIP